MSAEPLVTLLEEIRDQQQRQITNFEEALQVQQQAQRIQERGRSILLTLIAMPWLLVVILLAILLFDRYTG